MPTLERILIHPVKSCRGIEVESARVTRAGLHLDRWFALVDAAGRTLTQKRHPRLASIGVRLDGEHLVLEVPGEPPSAVRLDEPRVGRRALVVLDVPMTARQYLDDELNGRLARFLGFPCALVRRDENHVRLARRQPAGAFNETVFSDGYPVSVISTASLAALNERLATPVEMERFRPNLVIGGTAPHDEDRWTSLRIGGIPFTAVKPIARCVMIQIDPATAEIGEEPGRTLNGYRSSPEGILFGSYFAHGAEGVLRAGMEVHVEKA